MFVRVEYVSNMEGTQSYDFLEQKIASVIFHNLDP